ncbi:MAG: PadR family transcriptional regulator, partial [Candidatus Aenigmarchaeota archaeon]|nr:PadR family transcriptional regulator [Candidatus Aenigmarchaeota archaeon]
MKKIFLRGFLKSLILTLLKKKSMHGYVLIKEIKNKTFFWEPSPGTIYPLLKKLERKGLIKKRREERKFVYYLTEKGEKEVKDLMKIRKEIKDEIKKFLKPFSISYVDFFENKSK